MEIPGPLITRAEEPRLFDVIDVVAREMNATVPNEVYLIADVNILVTEIGRLFGEPRRILAIGLGILSLLSRIQLRSALAHEYAHYTAGDYYQGPLAAMARNALRRATMHASSNSVLTAHIGAAIEGAIGPQTRRWHERSREAELAADEHAVAIYGGPIHTETVVRGALGSALFEAYIAREVQPLVQMGFRPERLVEGFSMFIENEHEIGFASNTLAFLRKLETDPLDTHPTLQQRIRHLLTRGQMESTVVDEDARVPARDLVSDLARRDREVTDAWATVQRVDACERVSWSDVGTRVLEPGLRANFTGLAELVAARLGVTVAPADVLALLVEKLESGGREALAPLLQDIGPRFVGFDDPLVALAGMLTTGTALSRGSRLVYVPGIPLRVTTTEGPLDPFRAVADAAVQGDAALLALLKRLTMAPALHPSLN